jgi:hypothetical protein
MTGVFIDYLYINANISKVVSPFQAILDYELSKKIPPGWVNYSISKTKPNGFWHRLERGEGLMDKEWFAGFTSDLHNQQRWEDFYQRPPRLCLISMASICSGK